MKPTPATPKPGADLAAQIDAILDEIDAVLAQQEMALPDGERSPGA